MSVGYKSTFQGPALSPSSGSDLIVHPDLPAYIPMLLPVLEAEHKPMGGQRAKSRICLAWTCFWIDVSVLFYHVSNQVPEPTKSEITIPVKGFCSAA